MELCDGGKSPRHGDHAPCAAAALHHTRGRPGELRAQPVPTAPPTPHHPTLQPPLMRGAAIDVPALQRALQQRTACGEPGMPALWRQARRVVLQHALQLLALRLERMEPPATEQAKLTSGVSYVVQTESCQVGAGGVLPLPHVVYQPPGLREVTGSHVDALAEVLAGAATTAAVLPLHEDNDMKSYLLLPAKRRELLHQHGGHLTEACHGSRGLELLLQDHSFICLHFRLDQEGLLCPVPLASQPAAAIEQSNVQLGVCVKKGVGGTCPLRSAARRLGAAGLLPMLLDDAPQPLPPASPDHREVVDAGALPHTVAPACAAEPVHTLADEQVPTPASAAGDLSAAPARQNCSTKSLGAAFAAVVHTGELGGAQHAAVAAISTLSSNQHQHPPMPAADVCTRVSNAAPGVTMPSLVAGTATMTASVGQRPPVSNSPVEHVSTIELEAALHRAAAELRAAEAAAMAAADDQDMPDFEGEDAADDAAERVEGSVTEAENKCADGSVQALAVELAGEEGVEELLQEMEEAQKLQPSATDEPASTGQPAASCDNALPLWHTAKHRLSTYTFSSRLELYVEQATWERLDRTMREALHSAVHRVERLLLQELAAANCRRLADFCQQLQASVGTDALTGDIADLVLGGGHCRLSTLPPPNLDFNEAVVLTAGCLHAASCIGARRAGWQMPWPFYLISTRDSFAHHLVPIETRVEAAGRQYTRTDYFLRAAECPTDYHDVMAACRSHDFPASTAAAKGMLPDAADPGLLPIGVTTYRLFNEAELASIETEADNMDARGRGGLLPEACFHHTVARGGALKRTKYFTGARYLWTREQLADADAHVAGGVRVDVPPPPAWMRRQVETPLVEAGIAPDSFVNSIALNLYYGEGIQSHFDDATRFQQPILSLRLFSDSRLSFGTHLYGTNGLFFIPLPRGCIMVMDGFAANKVKHSVRATDMTGKSAGMILRRINPQAWAAAQQLHMEETCFWLRCLSLSTSARASTLLAARRAAAGAASIARGAGASCRQPRIPAAERREMWRLMQAVVRRAEQEERHERLESVTAQLMLLSALRKVEAADRLGIDLAADGAKHATWSRDSSCDLGEAACVFSVLDDAVSFVERPNAALLKKQPTPRKRRAGQVQEVRRVLQRIVRAVESEDWHQDSREIAQVVLSMMSCTEAAVAMQQSKQVGRQPARQPAAGGSAVQSARAAAEHRDAELSRRLPMHSSQPIAPPQPLTPLPVDLDDHHVQHRGHIVPSPRLSLQPSWQASLASRKELDYGEL